MAEDSLARLLTADDVAKLLSDPSPETRVATSTKIANQYSAATLNAEERGIAEDIFRALVKDTEVKVRQALTAQLKSSGLLPRDVALALAQDVDAVALPMIKASEVLTDDDLISILRSASPAKQSAVAQRSTVSGAVSDAVIETGNEEAVARLVRNRGADLSEAAYDRVVDTYRDSDNVTGTLARRPDLPPAISARVVAMVSDRLHQFMVSKRELSPDVAAELVLQVRERALMGLLEHGSSDAELDTLIDQLHQRNNLTPSLLLRALCVGDLNFFERSLVKLTGLPLKNVRILIHDKGMLGFESLYMRAELPRPLFPAFRAAIVLAVEAEYDGGHNDRERYIERLLERLLTRFADPAQRINPRDLEFLIAKLKQFAA